MIGRPRSAKRTTWSKARKARLTFDQSVVEGEDYDSSIMIKCNIEMMYDENHMTY